MDISVIIPSYDAQETIGRCLESITSQKTGFSYEVIVVDSSPDDRVGKIVGRFPGAKFIKLKDRTFQGIARNIGSQSAAGELAIFVDADIIMPSDWLENAAHYYKKGHDIFAGSIEMDPERKNSVADRVEWYFEFSEFKPSMPYGTRWCLPAYAIGLKKRLFEEDPFCDMAYSEDTELTARLRAKGHILYFNPALMVFHNSHHGLIALLKKMLYHGRYHIIVRNIRDISGSGIIKIKPLAFFAVPFFAAIKLLKISWRNIRYNGWHDKVMYTLLMPVTLVIIAIWMAGVYQEIFFNE